MKKQNGIIRIIPILTIIAAVGVVSFLLISSVVPFQTGLFVSLFPKSSSHAASNGTSISNLSLASTYESISVYVSFSDDLNANNSAILKWRKSDETNWKTGMEMSVDRRTTLMPGNVPNPYVNQWRASVIGLTKNTGYEIQVSLTDPDGISGTNPITQTITTRNDQYPSPGNTFYVAPNGVDATNPGTQAAPFKTIQKAVDTAGAGDTILVRAGTYKEMVNIKPKIGADSQHFLNLKNFGTERPIIDGANNPDQCGGGAGSSGRCAMLVRSRYLKISGFEITNVNNGIKVTAAATSDLPPGNTDTSSHDLIIENNLIHNITYFSDPSIGILISNSNTEQPIFNVTIQNNVLHAAPRDPNWGVITFNATQGGHVIRDNKIYFSHRGTPDIHGADCISGLPNTTITGGQSKDTDIYNNYCEGATDDAISLDGGAINERVWGNEVNKSNLGISVAPIVVGPAYVFRNVLHDFAYNWTSCLAVKEGESGTGFVYFYHNTFEVSDPKNLCTPPGGARRAFALANYGSNDPAANLVFKNNIFHGYDVTMAINKPANINTLVLDYNMHFDDNGLVDGRFAKYGGEINYSYFHTTGTTTGFVEATGQEKNGLYAKPTYIDLLGGDFHLAANSPGINKGVLIKGFNDADSFWPIQNSAPEIGAYEITGLVSTPAPTFQPSSTPGTILGDLDSDMDVDIFDYNILVGNFGKTGTGIPGDIDRDGDVDIFDYNFLVGNFGQTA